jgi:hypothetical protein
LVSKGHNCVAVLKGRRLAASIVDIDNTKLFRERFPSNTLFTLVGLTFEVI